MKTHLLTLATLLSLAIGTIATAEPSATHEAVSTKPFQNWPSGFLTGNGNLGVIMCGKPYAEELVVTGKFYLPMGAREIMPDLSAFKDEFKKAGLAANGNGPAIVHNLMLQKSGQVLVNTDPLHPAFFLKLAMPGKPETVKNYRMTEDFATGELQVRWSDEQGDWCRQVFVSRPDNIVVMAITGPKGKVACDLAMTIKHPLVKVEPTVAGDGWLSSHNTYVRGKGGYDTLIRVVPAGGTMVAKDGGLAVAGADRILLIMQAKCWRIPLPKEQSEGWITSPDNPIYRNGVKTNLLPEMKPVLASLPADYAKLFAPHARAHGKLYQRVAIDLDGGLDRQLTSEELLARAAKEGMMPKALAERLYNACRYLIICSSGDTPPNLQGIWSGTWSPAWSGDYTTDSNLQLEVQSMMSCNMPELMESYFNLVDSWVPDWRLNAKKIYGFRGVVSNARASNVCLLLHWGGEWPGEQCAIGLASWMLHFYYDYYQFTGDNEFLARRFVPLAKEIALFYEDFLAGTEDANGNYRFYMGYSPEHGMSANTTFDIACAKNTFSTLIAACQKLGIEKENLPKWQTMLGKMPPYLRNRRGELKEWSWPGVGEDYNQRHHSHLLPFYQFCEFNRETDPELWKAAELAFLQKTKYWLHNAKTSNSNHITHGMMNQGQCAARAGRGDLVCEALSRLTTDRYVYPSFMISYWPGLNGYGFDPVGTIPDIVNNSLIFAWQDTVDILPALPRDWPRGSAQGLLLRRQIQLNELVWDIPAGKINIKLTSGKPQTITLQLPPGIKIHSARTSGRDSTLISDDAQPNRLKLKLPANQAAEVRITIATADFTALWERQTTTPANPKADWKIVSATAEGQPASLAIDNDPDTFWHTHTGAGRQPPPQSLVIDLGKEQELTGFLYLPRQDDNTTGNVTKYIVAVSPDGQTWNDAAQGEFANIVANPVQQKVRFAKPAQARYLKFTAAGGIDNCANAAEIGVMGK